MGCKFTDLRADPAEISLPKVSQNCVLCLPHGHHLPLWSWVVLGPGRLLALAEWMWTCSAALFFCLKTWWLAGIAGAGLPHGAFLSTSVEFWFWHVNYSIMAAEFLMWIGSFSPPLLFVIQHLQVTDRDAARALWCLKHSHILMYLIINRTDIHFSRDKDIFYFVFLQIIVFKRGWYFLLWANT